MIKPFNSETDLHLQGKARWGRSLPEIEYLSTSALGSRFDLKWHGVSPRAFPLDPPMKLKNLYTYVIRHISLN